MLKVIIKHGVVVDKIHEMSSIKISKWLGNCIGFITQNINLAETDLILKKF